MKASCRCSCLSHLPHFPLTTGISFTIQLQLETNTPIKVNPDSIYKPIERPERTRTKLFVPKRLQEALPFASKPKDERKRRKKGYVAKRAVVMEASERKKETFIQALNTIRREKVAIRKEKNAERWSEKARQNAKEEARKEETRKANRKRRYRAEGKQEKRRDEKRMKGNAD